MSGTTEFSEVGHCGGKLTITVATAPTGEKQYQLGFSHSSPTQASICQLYASHDGQPICFLAMGGLGDKTELPPVPGLSVLLASDMEGMYGHECPRCKNYWRADAFPVSWVTTCPYCALRTGPQYFLTKGQRKYISEYCKLVVDAVERRMASTSLTLMKSPMRPARTLRSLGSITPNSRNNTNTNARHVARCRTYWGSTASAHRAVPETISW